MEKTYATDVKIVRGHDDRASWVHACDGETLFTHLPLSVSQCNCGATLYTSAAVRLPCIADRLNLKAAA